MTRRQDAFSAAVSAVLAFLASMLIFAALLLGLAHLLRSDDSLHRRVAASVRTQQLELISSAVEEAAERWYFAPASVLPLVTEEEMDRLNGEAIEWWMGLTHGESTREPYLTIDGLEEAILADEQFQQAVEPVMRRSVARDEAADAIEQAILSAALPVRAQVLLAAWTEGNRSFDIALWLDRLPMLALCSLGAAMLCLIFLALLAHAARGAFLRWLGTVLGVVGLLGLCAIVLLLLIGLPGQVAVISPILAAELRVLFVRVGLPALALSIILFVLGQALIFRGRRPLREGSR